MRAAKFAAERPFGTMRKEFSSPAANHETGLL
jgi:hypothetical protein